MDYIIWSNVYQTFFLGSSTSMYLNKITVTVCLSKLACYFSLFMSNFQFGMKGINNCVNFTSVISLRPQSPSPPVYVCAFHSCAWLKYSNYTLPWYQNFKSQSTTLTLAITTYYILINSMLNQLQIIRFRHLPIMVKFSCLHTTIASVLSQKSSQTVPQLFW